MGWRGNRRRMEWQQDDRYQGAHQDAPGSPECRDCSRNTQPTGSQPPKCTRLLRATGSTPGVAVVPQLRDRSEKPGVTELVDKLATSSRVHKKRNNTRAGHSAIRFEILQHCVVARLNCALSVILAPDFLSLHSSCFFRFHTRFSRRNCSPPR